MRLSIKWPEETPMTVLHVTAPRRPVLAEWLLPGAWRLAGRASGGKDAR